MTSLRLLWRNSCQKISPLPSSFGSQRGFFSKNKNKNENNEVMEAPAVGVVDPPPASTPAVVYQGTMDGTVYGVKHFSLFTSGLIILSQPLVWNRVNELSSPFLKSALGGGMAFFFFATPILIHTFTKKYVIQLTFDQDSKEFEATTYSLFLTKKKFKFNQADIKIPPTPLPFTTVYAKGSPLLLIPDGWKSRYAYDHCMLLEKTSIDWSQIKGKADSK